MNRLVTWAVALAVAGAAVPLFAAATAVAVTCTIENGAKTTTDAIVVVDWDLGENTADTEYAYRVDNPAPPPQDSETDWYYVFEDAEAHFDLVELGDSLGVHTVYYWFREDADDTTYDTCSDSIERVEYKPRVDKKKPVAHVVDTTVKRGRYAVVRFSASDGQSGIASLRVSIKGTTLVSFSSYPPNQAPTTCRATWRFRCTLHLGTHRIDMVARDQAGNVTRRHAVLTVR